MPGKSCRYLSLDSALVFSVTIVLVITASQDCAYESFSSITGLRGINCSLFPITIPNCCCTVIPIGGKLENCAVFPVVGGLVVRGLGRDVHVPVFPSPVFPKIKFFRYACSSLDMTSELLHFVERWPGILYEKHKGCCILDNAF